MKVNTIISTIEKQSEKLQSRKLPNSISSKNEHYDWDIADRIKFYKDDMEKMSSMTDEQISSYKEKLLKSGRYYKEKYELQVQKVSSMLKNLIDNIS